MSSKIVYLTGFMGAGKSTIGPILANTLGWDFYDLDRVIEDKLNKKVTEIFQAEGEDFFRKVESETLEELSKGENIIVSLGGGTVTKKNNLDIIRNTGKIIYLKASLDSVYNRLKFKRDRPILYSGDEEFSKERLIQKLERLMSERKKYYEQADVIIDTDEVSVGKTVDIIAKIINKDNKV